MSGKFSWSVSMSQSRYLVLQFIFLFSNKLSKENIWPSPFPPSSHSVAKKKFSIKPRFIPNSLIRMWVFWRFYKSLLPPSSIFYGTSIYHKETWNYSQDGIYQIWMVLLWKRTLTVFNWVSIFLYSFTIFKRVFLLALIGFFDF